MPYSGIFGIKIHKIISLVLPVLICIPFYTRSRLTDLNVNVCFYGFREGDIIS